MAKAQRNDPYSALNFLVEIDGISIAAFRECSGLTSEMTIVEYRNGSEPNSVRKLPGLRKYTNITLKRGITKDRQLWDWHKAALDGNVQRKNGSIVLLDDSGQEVLRWNFRAGWPSKYEAPALNATSNEVAIETLEIAHEGFELA